MKSSVSMALVLAAGALALARPAVAQQPAASSAHLAPGQWAVDGSVGFAVPVGNFGNGLNTGIDLMGAVEYHPVGTGPFYFRGEVGWTHFGASGGGGHATILRFDADGLYDFPLSGTPLNVYALAGLGLYHVSVTADICGFDAFGNPVTCGSGSTGLGINFGGGVRYPISTLQVFFELRYQLPLTAPGSLSNAPFFPFQFGVRYPLG